MLVKPPPGPHRWTRRSAHVLVLLLATGLACTAGPQGGASARNGDIAFVRSRGRVAHIMAVDPVGEPPRTLGPGTGTQGSPSWSPDGERLAFVWRRWPSGFNVFVMGADGGGLQRLTRGRWIDGTPTWSPDGGRLAFSSNRQVAAGFGIYIVDLLGGAPQRLAEGVAPDWSPTGGAIVFARALGGASDVFAVPPEGGEARNLTDHPADDRDPDWSPDGTRIAFASDRDGDFDLYVMDADGGDVRQVTDDPGDELWPEWSPDGMFIAFTSATSPTSEIWFVDLDGSRATRVTSGPLFDATPAWQPLLLGDGGEEPSTIG